MSARIRSRSSSTEIRSLVATRGQYRVGLDPLRTRSPELDVPDDLDPLAEGPVALDLERGRLAQRRDALGEALLELADELVVAAVEVDERHLLDGLVEREAVRQVVDVGAQHEQVVGRLHRDEPVAADLDE